VGGRGGAVNGAVTSSERRNLIAGGTVGALRFALTGLRELPGRKSLIFFSSGLPLRAGHDRTPFGEALSSLVNLANQSSVVVYTVDARGVTTDLDFLGGAAAPLGKGGDPGIASRLVGQDGLSAFAEPTGGLFLQGQNDVSQQVGKVLSDQRGYYLIGYIPSITAFHAAQAAGLGRPAFHNIRLKVKRKGLAVRSRNGYYGIPEDDSRIERARAAGTLLNALVSPFDSSDVRLHLSSVFFHDSARRALLRSFLRVDANDLSFAEDKGSLAADVQVLGVTFDHEGRAVDQHGQDQEIRLSKEDHEKALRWGINYTIDVPVKKPGAYELRVAFRDKASGRVGSAYQFAEVPDLKANRLSLSGIFMADAPAPDGLVPDQPQTAEVPEGDRGAIEALRVFPGGRPFSYGLEIYNAQLTKDGRGVEVTTQMRLFREGQQLMTGEQRPLDLAGQKDPKVLLAGGTVVLPSSMPAGEYVLQVTVIDALAPPKQRIATQAASFEVSP